MILWINGAFGSGKTTTAYELHRRLKPLSYVYDPENVGYFLRKNEPIWLQQPNFQDEPLWRKFNFEMLSYLAECFDGVIIVPMTVINPTYYQEIIGRLRKKGIRVDHYVLGASQTTLLKRLRRRLESKHSWAAQQIPLCLKALQNPIFEHCLETDQLQTEDIIQLIGNQSGLEIQPDTDAPILKWIRKKIVLIKHIRS